MAHRNFGDLAIDRDNLLVAVKRRGVQLDFGGVGKGYALDEMARILRSEQYAQENWLLDAGTSTILVSGGPWPLGVGGAWKSRTRIETVLKMSSGALSGSGFEIQGAHITDPRTGEAASRWVQSWVRAPSGAVADALSTAALSLSSRELDAAAAEFGASILVARKQSRFADRFRDPLKWHPSPPD